MSGQKCRICLKFGTLQNIFTVSGSLMISTKIMTLANVAIFPNDGLPTTICLTCLDRLENCIEFVEQCEKSDQYLRSKCIDIVNAPLSIKEKQSTSGANKRNNSVIIFHDTNKEKCEISLVHELPIGNTSNVNEDTFEKENINKSKNSEVTKNFVSKKSQKQQCFMCGRVMSSRFRLKTHLRTHTGERPFSCPHCNKNFSLAQNLKVHLRVHTGEKPFRCSVCGEAFAHSAGLAVHRRKHTGQKPYQCLLCPRNFRTVGHLQYHVRRHTGAKNFECATCGRAFITRSDLKQHLVTHSGEKSHVCCICGTRMTRASHLKRHIRIVHGDEKLLSKVTPKCENVEDKCIKDDLDKLQNI